jgi:hypothetical protein
MFIDCVQILLLLEPQLGTKQVCDVIIVALKLLLNFSITFKALFKLIASNENTIPTLLSFCGSRGRLSEETSKPRVSLPNLFACSCFGESESR